MVNYSRLERTIAWGYIVRELIGASSLLRVSRRSLPPPDVAIILHRCKAVAFGNVGVSEAERHLQRKCMRTSSLRVFRKASPTASKGIRKGGFLFVPIVSGGAPTERNKEMKKTIERITSTAILSVAFMLSATSAWAATGDIVTLKNDSGFSYSSVTLTASDTYTISIPETQGLSNGDYVRLESFSYGMGSSNDGFNASVIKVTDYANNVITLGKANEYGGWTSSKFANNSWKQSFGRGDICILKVGETYNFQLLGSAGTATSQKVWAAEDTSRATSPVAQSTTDTNKRMTQEIVLTKLGGKPISATVNENNSPVDLTSLSWDEDLPEDLSQCPTLIIKVTGNATINIDSAITAYQVIFRVSEGATAKIIGAAIATSSGIAACGEGTVDLTEATFSGGVSGGGTVVINDSSCTQSIIQNSGLDVVTIKGGSYLGSWTGSPEFFTHTVFDGGSHSLTFTSAGGDYRICRNSSNNDPLWTIRNDTTLSIAAHDFGGYTGGGKASSCVIAVEDGGTLNLNRSGSSTFYYQGRFLLNPGSTMNLGAFGDATKFRINGGTTSGQEQIYVPDQVSASDKHATIADISGNGTGRINTGNNSTVGIGVYVGSNAQLDCLAAVGNGNGATPIVKRGAGVWKQSGSMSTYTGTLTVEAGTFALLNALDVNENMSLKFSAGTTLAIEETAKGVISDGTVTLKVTSDSAVPNIVVYKAGTTTPIPGATISKDNTNLTISYTPVSASGSLCWMDFEFNGNANSSGRLSAQLKSYVKTNGAIYYTDGGAAYMDCQPGTKEGDPAFTFPSEWTAVIRCKAPVHNNDKPMVLLMCGNGGSELYDDLVGVVVTKDGEIGLALKDGVVSSPVSVDNVSSAQHTYIIRKSSSKVALYIDGELSVETDATPAPAGAFQVGCVWKNLSSHSIYAPCASFTQNGQVDYLRFFDCALGDNMLAAIMSSNPWPSVTLDNVDGTDWSALSWSDDFDPDGNTQVTVASASSIEVGSATTIGMLKLVGSADLTIANIGNLTVTEFDLSDYTGNLTLSVDSVATATTWKFTGSADVTVVSSAKLTLGTLDLSEYSGSMVVDGPTTSPVAAENALSITTSASVGSSASLTISHNALVLANGVLTGAGTLYLDPGEGNSYTMSQSNTGYTGEAVIKSGTVKMGNATSFGDIPRTIPIRVKGGATLDENLKDAVTKYYSGDSNKLVFEDGAILTSSTANLYQGTPDNKYAPFSRLKLEGNAAIVANDADVALAIAYNYSPMHIELGENTLVKTGSHDFYISYPEIIGTGVIDIQSGTLTACPSYLGGRSATFADGTLRLALGTVFRLMKYNSKDSPHFTVKNLELNGSITRESEDSVLTVTGSLSGTGSTPMLTMTDGATLKPHSLTGGLTVTSSLTLSGHINVDVSEIDLTGKSKLAIITSPLKIDKDTQVATFTRGSNSEDWVLYSEEVSTGVYELGVKLNKTIESSLSWSGSSGTWSANGFNAVEDSFYNDANQTVVFADDAGSSSDPLAVAVSGDKTVNALNFTADNRNVTLSGDAITAATVSKSGDGVAIVNNALSGITSISVTDGVLVLNPNGEEVANVDGLEAGTLVIYVGSGETRTVTESISAAKIVKRGAGALNVTAIDPFNISTTIDDGKVVIVSAPSAAFVVNGNGVLELTNTGSYKDDRNVTNFSNVTGTGTIRYAGSGWRSFPSSNMFADTLSVKLEQESGVPIPVNNIVVGSISGSKNLRTDLGDTGKTFTVKQANDGVWEGSFHGGWDGLEKFVVQGGDATTGTLTLAGTTEPDGSNTYNDKLEVAESGSVNLTGSWIGDTTVNGEFGGTGSITGALTLNAGSTFKVWATGGLTATGVLTLPEEGKITVDVSELTIGAQASTTILTVGSGMDLSKFNLVGSNTHLLQKSGQVLNLVPIAARLTNGNSVTPFAGVDAALGSLYPLAGSNSDAYVTVTPGFSSGFTDEELLETYGIFHDTVNGIFGFAAAEIGTTTYVSLSAAVAAASASGDTITLLRDTAEQEIALNNKSITLDESSYTFSGSFTGSGTLVLPEGTLLKSATAATWAEGWTGTVWLRNYTSLTGTSQQGSNSHGSTNFEPNNYGNSNSTVRFTGVKGYLTANDDGSYTIQPALELEDDGDTPGLLLYNGWGYNSSAQCYTIIRELKGSGTLAADTTLSGTSIPGLNVLLQVRNWANFTGTLNMPNKNIVFGSTLPAQADVEGGGHIAVQSDASVEVPAGKTWTVGNGVVVNGSLSLGTDAAIVNKTVANTWVKRGTGTITLNAPSDLPATPDSNWAGTVVLPVFTAGSGHNLNKYGVEGSKVQLTGITDGWLDMPTSTINPEIVLAGNVTLTDSSNRTWTFKKVSGTGNLSLTPGASNHKITIRINDLASTVGTISNNMGSETTWTIDKISFPAETSLPAGTKILSTDGNGPVIVSGVTVGGVATPIPIKYKEDGVYVGYGTTFTVY